MTPSGSRRSCSPSAPGLPTPFRGPLQWAVLKALMRGETLTARQVERAVNAERVPRLAYTTVRTALERLVERGLVRREPVGAIFVYRSNTQETEMVEGLVAILIDGLSGFGPGALQAVRDRLDCTLDQDSVAS